MSTEIDELDDGLTSQQREAVRLDFLGGSTNSIGRAVGVSHTQAWRWRKLPAYQAALADLNATANRETLGKARDLRERAIKLTAKALLVLERRVDDAEAGDELERMSTSDLVQIVKAAQEVYKTTASQTGIAQVAQVDHGGRVEVAQVHVVLAADAEADIFDGSDETPPP